MKPRSVLIAGAVAALVFGIFSSLTVGQNTKTGGSSALEFKGNVVVVYSKSNRDRGGVLEKAELKRLGDREFLVGTGVEYGGNKNWTQGRTIWLALDEVSYIAEFPNIESFQKAGEDQRP